MTNNAFNKIGLPNEFGVVLLIFSFILLIAPYLSGFDFGIFKIPRFSKKTKQRLKYIGPIIFIICLLLYYPFFEVKPLAFDVDRFG